MISQLEGKVLDAKDRYFVLNVGGVGYKIFSHAEVIRKIPRVGQSARFFTHLHVREDIMDLYGFLEEEERDFFEMLISISGIGPKSALGILEVAPVLNLKQAIVSEDESFFTKVSGIGRKTAERLILELKSRLSKSVAPQKGSDSEQMGEALDALVGLGYTQRDARRALQEISKDIRGVEAKVKSALKFLGKK